jgi:hypothetical protein
VAFISPGDLAEFVRTFSYMDDPALITHLGARPSSSFRPRFGVAQSLGQGRDETEARESAATTEKPQSALGTCGGPSRQQGEKRRISRPLKNSEARSHYDRMRDISISGALSEWLVTDMSRSGVVMVKCDKCGKSCGSDYTPRWHRETGEYVARQRQGCPEFCTLKKVWLQPVDDDIAFIRMTTVAQHIRHVYDHEAQFGPVLRLGPCLTEDQLQDDSHMTVKLQPESLESTLEVRSQHYA